MATYNKRGYKAPKPKEAEEDQVDYVDGESTTEEVFNTLDETANRTEEWIAKNQNIIMSIIGVIALLTAAYLLFGKFVSEPKEEKASAEMVKAQEYFAEATSTTVATDSLFNQALNGGEGEHGFLFIAKEYSGTKAGNLANYYAGISYLNLKKYKEAIAYLEQFSSDDELLNAVAVGSIGDAFAEIGQNDQALKFYSQAVGTTENEFIKPIYLLKAGQTALLLNDKATALKNFTTIQESYKDSQQANGIDAMIGLAL